jgi:hypothetical protein
VDGHRCFRVVFAQSQRADHGCSKHGPEEITAGAMMGNRTRENVEAMAIHRDLLGK